MCGERVAGAEKHDCFGGSSPRVRGTQLVLLIFSGNHRIIPACAGNAYQLFLMYVSLPDHPRVCGERGFRNFSACSTCGSSPRVRGTPRRGEQEATRFRIIPACAGNACEILRKALAPLDHPRVCGERGSGAVLASRLAGSSPRVRGTRLGEYYQSSQQRIIPACAGNATSGQPSPHR